MKIIDEPQFGPMFRFNDANVYWSLYLLSGGRRLGRKRLAEEVGVGEGSMRRIIETLKEWDFIDIKQTGITITKAGQAFLTQVPIRPVEVFIEGSVLGKYQQGVIVLGCADKVNNGMEQRDAGIKVGGEGCTTLVIRDGCLMIPPDWNLDEKMPDTAYRIRKETGLTQDDALVIGGGDTPESAVEAAITAAFAMFRCCTCYPIRYTRTSRFSERTRRARSARSDATAWSC